MYVAHRTVTLGLRLVAVFVTASCSKTIQSRRNAGRGGVRPEPPAAGRCGASEVQRSAVGRRSEEVAARGAGRRGRSRRPVLGKDGVGRHRQPAGRDLRDRGRDRRSRQRVAWQPGHLEGQGLHRECLQHRRLATFDRAPLHADATWTFVVGRRRSRIRFARTVSSRRTT